MSRFLDAKTCWGVGLRPCHYPDWHSMSGELPFLEVMSDNFMYQEGGPGLGHLHRLKERAHFVLHGVGLNIGSAFELDECYLKELVKLKKLFSPSIVSDHLCFTRTPHASSFDLLPFAYSEFNLKRMISRVQRVQDALQMELTLENLSSYVFFRNSDFTEFEFLMELCRRSGCRMLLDVNNLYVSAYNHGFSAQVELKKLHPEFVNQYHIAGHSDEDGFYFDTHDKPIKEAVWSLMRTAFEQMGPRPIILERDDDASSLSSILEEVAFGQQLLAEVEKNKHE
jgi:uncharacterized protein (UPF0276 family)